MTSLTQYEGAGSAPVRLRRLALHRETLSNLAGSQASGGRGGPAVKTHKGHTCVFNCTVTCGPHCTYPCAW